MSSGADHAEVRTAFDDAAGWYLSVLDRVPPGAWDGPGLGEWSVRELAAHTARAFVTIEQYLASAPGEPTVAGPVAYFRDGLASPDVEKAVAERGRRQAIAFGDDLVGKVGVLADRVRALVDVTADDAICNTFLGGMRFADYLVTRVVELTVHTSDLCAALGLDDQPPEPAAAVTFGVLARLAATRPDRAMVLLAVTGRDPLPPGTTLLG